MLQLPICIESRYIGLTGCVNRKPNCNYKAGAEGLVYALKKVSFKGNIKIGTGAFVLYCERIGKNRLDAIIIIGLCFKEQVAEKGL